ncbi:MAG TPA: DUF1579 family protein [Candidatus Eisenbacteria bacterium]|nr:DUF1579 family protein [Candidatus Eisenbacteria bacterium]
MMLRGVIVRCLLVGLVASSAIAQTTPPAKATEGPLTPVAWLVGGTWVSDVKDPQDGTTTHVENHISWAPNHAAIQFVTDFNGKPHYNGFYAYDPAKKTINFFYTSESGQLTIGTATPDLDGKTLRQEFDVMQPKGSTGHIRSTIVRDGDDAYWFTVFLQDKSGGWMQAFKIRYERK